MSQSAQLELSNWCRGEGLSVKQALMLYGVSENEDISVIEEAMETIKILGKVRVRGKIFDAKTQTVTVLCECRGETDPTKVPPEIDSPTEGVSWTIIVAQHQPDVTDNFSEKLAQFLQAEGKTMEDIPTVNPSGSEWTSNPESIIRAVGEVLRQNPKPSESNNYRRLRTFSGVTPTPVGEENLDSWLDQARFMAEEYECSEKEKKRRVVESLKGPALEIIQAVRWSNPDASCMEYIQAIDNTFGSTESGEDLYLSFKSLYQKPNERLSEFLRRLEKSLSKVIRRGGLPGNAGNRARLDQLIKGAVESDLLLIQLNLRDKRDNPPTFLDLLREIREAEDLEAARRGLRKPATRQHVHATQAEKTTESEVHHDTQLRAEIAELKASLQEQRNTLSQSVSEGYTNRSKEESNIKSQPSQEIQALRAEVVSLKQQIRVMTVQPTPYSKGKREYDRNKVSLNPKAAIFKPQPKEEFTGFFCYKCGEDGHVATKCAAPENPSKVIKKLIRQVRGSPTEPKESSKSTDNDIARVNTMEVSKIDSDLPEGLVGPSAICTIKINDLTCDALMDSGSNVTIILEAGMTNI